MSTSLAGCVKDADCYAPLGAVTPEDQAKVCCSYIGIHKIPAAVSATADAMAKQSGFVTGPLEKAYTKMCIPGYKDLPQQATTAGLSVTGDVYEFTTAGSLNMWALAAFAKTSRDKGTTEAMTMLNGASIRIYCDGKAAQLVASTAAVVGMTLALY